MNWWTIATQLHVSRDPYNNFLNKLIIKLGGGVGGRTTAGPWRSSGTGGGGGGGSRIFRRRGGQWLSCGSVTHRFQKPKGGIIFFLNNQSTHKKFWQEPAFKHTKNPYIIYSASEKQSVILNNLQSKKSRYFKVQHHKEVRILYMPNQKSTVYKPHRRID
jgi:hypothetical protein